MDPRWLFPLLAVLFTGAAVVRSVRQRKLDPACKTWLLMAGIFAAVSLWLRLGPL